MSAGQQPPLPLVSRDRTLWAKPLAHTSTVVALAAILPVATSWGRATVWVTVLPIYLASCTWLVATFTYGFGMLGGLDRLSGPSVSTTRGSQSDAFERRLLYAASILAFGVGVHATAQLNALAGLADRTAFAWHLVIAAGLSLIGWGVATVIAVQLPVAIAAADEASSNREPRELYSGLLHCVVGATAFAVLLMAVGVWPRRNGRRAAAGHVVRSCWRSFLFWRAQRIALSLAATCRWHPWGGW